MIVEPERVVAIDSVRGVTTGVADAARPGMVTLTVAVPAPLANIATSCEVPLTDSALTGTAVPFAETVCAVAVGEVGFPGLGWIVAVPAVTADGLAAVSATAAAPPGPDVPTAASDSATTVAMVCARRRMAISLDRCGCCRWVSRPSRRSP